MADIIERPPLPIFVQHEPEPGPKSTNGAGFVDRSMRYRGLGSSRGVGNRMDQTDHIGRDIANYMAQRPFLKLDKVRATSFTSEE